MKNISRFWALPALPLALAFIEPHRVQVRRLDVVLPDLPSHCDGLRIAQLSDLHCSLMTSRKVIRRAVDLCNAEKPDVVALTGDYISRPDSYLAEFLLTRLALPPLEYAHQCMEELSRLRAPEGVFAVRGNHDFAAGGFGVVDKLLRGIGVRVLVNASTRLREELPLIGVDDLREGDMKMRQACEGIAPDVAQVVLSHNPRALHLLKNRNALVLSGHTHGGQVHLPLSSFRRRPHDMHFSEFHDGWYHNGRAQMWVSVGVGSVHFPLRFNCPPEVCVFTLKAV